MTHFTPDTRPFADVLKEFHGQEGWTRDRAASELRVPRSTYDGWCAGRPSSVEGAIRRLVSMIVATPEHRPSISSLTQTDVRHARIGGARFVQPLLDAGYDVLVDFQPNHVIVSFEKDGAVMMVENDGAAAEVSGISRSFTGHSALEDASKWTVAQANL